MKNEKKIWLIEQYAQKAWTVSLVLSQEAARAGEHGKGYAVVAHEARVLADKLYDCAARVRFDRNDEPGMFESIVKFVKNFKIVFANAVLEAVNGVKVSMDFNIPKSMMVFAMELRRIAEALEELIDPNLRSKPAIIPEVASPSEKGAEEFFLCSVKGHLLIEKPKNILEIASGIRTINGFSIRGENLPVIDFRKILDLPPEENAEQTFMIIQLDKPYAVPIDDLDINAIFYSSPGIAVTPDKKHAFASLSRECWDMVGGDQAVFVDWQKTTKS